MILDYLNQIAATTKKTEKLSILESIKGTEDESLFLMVAAAAYDSSVAYHIKEFDMPEVYHPHVTGNPVSLRFAINWIETELATRSITGDAAKTALEELLADMGEEDAEVVKRVIKRDLRCGISASSINKVWPGHVYDHPYMRCSSFSEKNMKKLVYPYFAQTKLDGLYCDIIVDLNSVKYVSRSGNDLRLNQTYRDTILIARAKEYGHGFVIQGEALVLDENGEIMDREVSNGYLNSDDRDMNRIIFETWDTVHIDSFFQGIEKEWVYADRFEHLQEIIKACGDIGVHIVNTQICDKFDDVIDFFREVREDGQEGLVLKNMHGLWKNGTSTDQVKVKVVIEVEMQVIGYKEGKGKYEGMVGSILCQSSCGKVQTYVAGLSDKERADLVLEIPEMTKCGQIVTVKCNGVVQDSKTGIYSVYLPRKKEFRIDKTEADTLESMQEQEAAFLDILKLIA